MNIHGPPPSTKGALPGRVVERKTATGCSRPRPAIGAVPVAAREATLEQGLRPRYGAALGTAFPDHRRLCSTTTVDPGEIGKTPSETICARARPRFPVIHALEPGQSGPAGPRSNRQSATARGRFSRAGSRGHRSLSTARSSTRRRAARADRVGLLRSRPACALAPFGVPANRLLDLGCVRNAARPLKRLRSKKQETKSRPIGTGAWVLRSVRRAGC